MPLDGKAQPFRTSGGVAAETVSPFLNKCCMYARTSTAAGLCWVCLCFFLTTAGAGGQVRGWLWQNPLPQGNAINAVRFAADKRHGWAVGSDGAILRTEDGGFEWEAQAAPVTTTLYGLFVKDKRAAVACGARGAIVATENGGERWERRLTPTRDHLAAVTFAGKDNLRGWAVGTY